MRFIAVIYENHFFNLLRWAFAVEIVQRVLHKAGSHIFIVEKTFVSHRSADWFIIILKTLS
jgi:hypothetical protein